MSDTETDATPAHITLHGCLLVESLGQHVLHVPKASYLKVVKALLADGYEMVADLTAHAQPHAA